MDDHHRTFYELQFKLRFREARGLEFQALFNSVMSNAHPGDFMPCRPWGNSGDRKNDGYLRSERTLFQVHTPNEKKQATTLRKIERDFTEALPHWQDHFDTWVFVHNSREGLSPAVLAKLLALEQANPRIQLRQWSFEELLLRFQRVPHDVLLTMFGPPPAVTQPDKVEERKRKRRQAVEAMQAGDGHVATKLMLEALELAREAGDESEEVEILAGLALLASDHRRGRGERLDYLKQAEQKADKLNSSAAKVIYLRARAAALADQRDLIGAEEAYRQALDHCLNDPEDEKGNLATQGCIVRSSLVHFLCNARRFEEALPYLDGCEEYARKNGDAEDGELLQAALVAGIHYYLETGNEDEVIRRISDLEHMAQKPGVVARIRGDLVNIANQSSKRETHRVALAAAQAAVRLGQRSTDPFARSFLVGALYVDAMVEASAGNEGVALTKARGVLDLCTDGDDDPIKQATHQLIAEIQRLGGDSQTAVDMARRALTIAEREPENIAFTKLALAVALNENGQTAEALEEAKEAWALAASASVPAIGMIDLLSQVTNYASQLGADEDLTKALTELRDLPNEPEEVNERRAHAIARAFANVNLRGRMLEVLEEENPAQVAGTTGSKSLPAANAKVMRPLLRLWQEWPKAAAELYDFWGRGNLERLLLNTRSFPNSFNVTLEVRSLEDVQRAVRMWGLYADFLILLWKGPTASGLAFVPFPEDYEEPGGWGYVVAAGSVIKKKRSKRKWHPALAHISMFPAEVAVFLATEARPFIEAGRLVVVPAVGVGCVNPGHGPFEQLLAEAANAIPSVRWRGIEGTRIGAVPYSPDTPFALLAEVVEVEADRLRKLRLLLLRRARELRADHEVAHDARLLALEIDDALRDLSDRNAALARKKGLRKATEPLAGATAPFKPGGERLSGVSSDSPFAPLFVLQSLGYGWRVESTVVTRFPPRFEPQEGDVIGTWLAPPSPGWTIPTAMRVDSAGNKSPPSPLTVHEGLALARRDEGEGL